MSFWGGGSCPPKLSSISELSPNPRHALISCPWAHKLSLAVALCILCILQNPKWKNPVGLGQVTRRPLEKSIVSWSSPAHPPICQLLIEISSIRYMMLNICEIDIFVWRNSVLIKLHQFWWHCTNLFSLMQRKCFRHQFPWILVPLENDTLY